MTKSSSSSGSSREGYQVGVFKNGRLKKIMKMKEGSSYIREKVKRMKEDRPKRECSEKQLQALAKGRAVREKNRASGIKPKPVKQRAPTIANAHRAKDGKSLPHKKKAEKSRVRREKENETGKYRSHESEYDSSASSCSSSSEKE